MGYVRLIAVLLIIFTGFGLTSTLRATDQQNTIEFINVSSNATIKIYEALNLLNDSYPNDYNNVMSMTSYIEGTPKTDVAFVYLNNNNTIYINNTYIESADTSECARILIHESTHLWDIRNNNNSMAAEDLELNATQNESYFLAQYHNWSDQKRQRYVNYKIASRYWETGEDSVTLFNGFEIADFLLNGLSFF